MKNKYFCLPFLSFLFAACITANTQQTNVLPTLVNKETSPTVSLTPQNVFPPTAEHTGEVLKSADTKLGLNNIQTMLLSRQPQEIINALAAGFGKSDDTTLKWAENISSVVGERDLNHDGIPERVIIVFSDGNGNSTLPEVKIFTLEKENWKCLSCSMLFYTTDNIEFVPTGKKGEFDTMRFRDKAADTDFLEDTLSASDLKRWKDYVTDSKVKNGKYDFYECRVENEKAKKVIACPQ